MEWIGQPFTGTRSSVVVPTFTLMAPAADAISILHQVQRRGMGLCHRHLSLLLPTSLILCAIFLLLSVLEIYCASRFLSRLLGATVSVGGDTLYTASPEYRCTPNQSPTMAWLLNLTLIILIR